jgi:hypothetical protein
LRQLGATVVEVVAYHTEVQDAQRPDDPDVYGMLLNGRLDVVTFTSASAVRNFAKIYGTEQAVDLLRKTVVAAIGPVTGDAARELGLQVTVQPAQYTVPALVDAIAKPCAAARTEPRTPRIRVADELRASVARTWQDHHHGSDLRHQAFPVPPTAPAAPHRGDPLDGARDAADARVLHLPAVRLRRRGHPPGSQLDARSLPAVG